MSRTLKFWGTRGSCPVSGAEYVKYGGNTVCLEICYDEAHIIIDAGTGIRPLGECLMQQGGKISIQLFLGHTHWDHVIGFPFFAPLYSADTEIYIWSPCNQESEAKEIFNELLSNKFFPIKLDQLTAKLYFRSIHECRPVQVGMLTLYFQKAHHSSVAYAFKIQTPHQTIGYASDNEVFCGYQGCAENSPQDVDIVSFFSGCDLLIHEAQYSPEEYPDKIGWGHSSIINVVSLIKKAKIKRWIVVHHDPKHTDKDLDNLAVMAQEMLNENDTECVTEWIGDGYKISLK